jgi:hypothetical protein
MTGKQEGEKTVELFALEMNYYSLRNCYPADREKGEEYNYWVEYSAGMESQDRVGVLQAKRFGNCPNSL